MDTALNEPSSMLLDLRFYGIWYQDLHKLDRGQLESHWRTNGKTEGRASNALAITKTMHWPIDESEWESAFSELEGKDLSKDNSRIFLLRFIQEKLISASRMERNTRLKSTEFDVEFYRSWHKDLSNLSVDQLESHWKENGINESRHGCFRSLVEAEGIDVDELPNGFDEVGYVALNRPVKKIKAYDLYKAAYHFLTKGQKLGYSYYFDPYFYAAFYEDLNINDNAISLLTHFTKFGSNEGRYPNVESYLGALDGRHIMSHFKSQISVESILRWNPHLMATTITQIIVQFLKPETLQRTKFYNQDIRNAEIYADLGVFFMRNGNNDMAIKAFHTSLSFHSLVLSYESLGTLYNEQGEIELAHEFLREAVRNNTRRLDLIELYLGTKTEEIGFSAINEVLEFYENYNAGDLILSIAEQMLTKMRAVNKLLATKNDRNGIENATTAYVKSVRDEFFNYYRRISKEKNVKTSLNRSRGLIIGDQFIPQCVRYRIEQKVDQIVSAGIEVKVLGWDSKMDQLIEGMLLNDIIIFYRCPAVPTMINLVEKAKSLGKLCIYEVDDFIFSSEFPSPIETYGGMIDSSHYIELCCSFQQYAEMAKACHFAIGSTQTIADGLGELVEYGRCLVHRNALDKHSIIRSKTHKNSKKTIDLFYGSATLAHNSDFTSGLLPVLIELLTEYPKLRLIVVGHLSLGHLLQEHVKGQVKLMPYVSNTGAYLELLGQSDINLAVLDRCKITDAKSEIKWLEAGAMGIPSIVSATSNYYDVIEEGKTGFIADSNEQWKAKLTALINDAELRNTVGSNAQEHIKSTYSMEAMSQGIREVLMNLVDEFESRIDE